MTDAHQVVDNDVIRTLAVLNGVAQQPLKKNYAGSCALMLSHNGPGLTLSTLISEVA